MFDSIRRRWRVSILLNSQVSGPCSLIGSFYGIGIRVDENSQREKDSCLTNQICDNPIERLNLHLFCFFPDSTTVNHNEKPLGIFIFWSFFPSTLSKSKVIDDYLGGGFKYFFYCHPAPWKSDPIWRPHIFSDGLVRKPPTTRWNFLSHLWKCHGWKQPRRLHNKSLTFSLSARSFFSRGWKMPSVFMEHQGWQKGNTRK